MKFWFDWLENFGRSFALLTKVSQSFLQETDDQEVEQHHQQHQEQEYQELYDEQVIFSCIFAPELFYLIDEERPLHIIHLVVFE